MPTDPDTIELSERELREIAGRCPGHADTVPGGPALLRERG
ncbi:hypothetical protein [Streptomyces sp. AK02-01A]|nr:hypothetical protein [Streptomyces sp. AK02-01A]MDX3851847.1 hypothetical protein [Streptomyces sp. AK02-01A]